MATRTEIQDELATLFRSRHTLIWVTTKEERRAERGIIEAAASADYVTELWDCRSGLVASDGEPVRRISDPLDMLEWVAQTDERRVYVLRDLDDWFDPMLKRALRSLARMLQSEPRSRARSVVILTPNTDMPAQIEGHAVTFEYPLPDREEVSTLLDDAIGALSPEKAATALRNGNRDRAIDAAVGMRAEEIGNCFARSLVSTEETQIDPDIVASEKRRIISKTKGLDWIDPDPLGLDAFQGYSALKEYISQEREMLSQEARSFGIEAPRGILLVGVQGCGKSLCATATPTSWGVPCIKLDIGGTRSKWVGESEGNIREAQRVLEAIGPSVCWIDEIEKALGGSSDGAADGGVGRDALGALLTWMQSRKGSTYVVATANDISALPPELLRKGRFDEIWFVDLPNASERRAILGVSVRKTGRDSEAIGDASEFIRASEGYTGSEIAAAVTTAVKRCYREGRRDLTAADVASAIQASPPLSQTRKESIDKLRTWAPGRARMASASDADADAVTATQPSGAARSLDIE
jgi:SpoVK/Ycf46/Vps4 family AAA+-type ATPase